MLDAPCYVVADAHLGAASAAAERGLIAFLRELPGRAGSLLINGDLFDFWFEWRRVIPRPAFRVLAALADLHDAGVPVLLIGGNHDCWGGQVLTGDVGLTYHLGPWDGRVAGWRAHVEHGDGLRAREDRRYRMLRRVLRNPLAIRAFRALHPDWASALASGSSDVSRVHGAGDAGAGLRAVAGAYLAQHPNTELVLFAHSHVTALERMRPGGIYANPGAWYDGPTHLVVREERVELRRWAASAEGELLHALDRGAEKALALP